jgi:rod shape-determining protein MreD
MAEGTITTESMRAARIRVRLVPVISTILGSLAALLPALVTFPALPPLGFLMLLAWRLLRPELWPVWIGLPLGLIDDLLSGQPFGTAISLWTLTLLLLDLMDSYVIWRDYWIDWIVAALAATIYIVSGYWFDGLRASEVPLSILWPQILISIVCFPALVRLCVRLDRWRLPL